jgi:hypothetical protein
VDLFEPGSGSQVHDFNGGVLQSGLFWTLRLDNDALSLSRNGRRAVLDAKDVSVIDSFQFGGPVATPATVSLHIEWSATAAAMGRGKGTGVPATDPGAFLGGIAPARSTMSFSGRELGLTFHSDPGVSTQRTYAQMGHERNGAFL